MLRAHPASTIDQPGSERASASAPAVAGEQTCDDPVGKLLDLGAEALTQDELVAILVGTGTRDRSAMAIAKDILDEHLSLWGLYERQNPKRVFSGRPCTLENLASIPGMGRRKAERILAAIALVERTCKLWKDAIDYTPPDPDTLPPEDENLAKVIGAGVKDRSALEIARALLTKHGGFRNLFGRQMKDLVAIRGISTVKAVRIAAVMEIARRLEHSF